MWRFFDRIGGRHCLLCGERAPGPVALCPACRQELPTPASRCRVCGVILPQPGICGACQNHPPSFDSTWVAFEYAQPLAWMLQRFKFEGDLAMGHVLAELLQSRFRVSPPPRPGLVLPVPLHPDRLRERGFNQALELVRPLARDEGFELHARGLERMRSTSPQAGLDAVARRKNLKQAFRLPPGSPPLPEHVAVFDDVMTTGSTVTEVARLLMRAGVRRVDVWCLARRS